MKFELYLLLNTKRLVLTTEDKKKAFGMQRAIAAKGFKTELLITDNNN